MKYLLKLSVLFTFLLFFLCFHTDEFVYIKSFPSNTTFLTSDMLGNFYIVQNNSLSKYNENGILVCSYDAKNKGTISSVDASNPLKILVYYKDFNQIVFLDNTLTQTNSPILLEELGISQSSLACTSYDNAFWIYDNTFSRLARFDNNLILQNQSENLAQSLSSINPLFMLEKNGHLFLNDSSNKVIIFDKYGTFYKTIPIMQLNTFQVSDNKFFYCNKSSLHTIDLNTFEEAEIPSPINEPLFFQLNNTRLYIANKSEVFIYKTQKNK